MGQGKAKRRYVRRNDPHYFDVVSCPDDDELGIPIFQGRFLVQDFNTTLKAGYFPTGMVVRRNGTPKDMVVYGKKLVSKDRYERLSKEDGIAYPHLELPPGVNHKALRDEARIILTKARKGKRVEGLMDEVEDLASEVYMYCSAGQPGKKYYRPAKVEGLAMQGWAELLAKVGLLFAQELPRCDDPSCEFCYGYQEDAND